MPKSPAFMAEAVEAGFLAGSNDWEFGGLSQAVAEAVWDALLKAGRIDYERDYGETITSRTVLVIPLESA